MGAAALALVRYPWQQLAGYSIEFLPISDAPSPGFYGNTNFTWGQPGGMSTLYVYPGETVHKLAGITAFEIGHEVDAAYVEPQGGHDQIETSSASTPPAGPPSATAPSRATSRAGTPRPSPTTGRRASATGARSPRRRPAPPWTPSSPGSTREFRRIGLLTIALPSPCAPCPDRRLPASPRSPVASTGDRS